MVAPVQLSPQSVRCCYLGEDFIACGLVSEAPANGALLKPTGPVSMCRSATGLEHGMNSSITDHSTLELPDHTASRHVLTIYQSGYVVSHYSLSICFVSPKFQVYCVIVFYLI